MLSDVIVDIATVEFGETAARGYSEYLFADRERCDLILDRPDWGPRGRCVEHVSAVRRTLNQAPGTSHRELTFNAFFAR
jgi:hypothetical protein